jgi:hypothetical protein
MKLQEIKAGAKPFRRGANANCQRRRNGAPGRGAVQLIYRTPDGGSKERLLLSADEPAISLATVERPFSFEAPFNSPDWLFEFKLDGYRTLTVFDDAGEPYLWSRNGLPLETKLPAIAVKSNIQS